MSPGHWQLAFARRKAGTNCHWVEVDLRPLRETVLRPQHVSELLRPARPSGPQRRARVSPKEKAVTFTVPAAPLIAAHGHDAVLCGAAEPGMHLVGQQAVGRRVSELY